MTRRNPKSANRRRTGGPPAPPTAEELRALRPLMAAWTRRFRERRGCPAWVAANFIVALRRKGAWFQGEYDVPRPDGGPMMLP